MKFLKYIVIALAPLALALSANAQSAAQPAPVKPVVTETNTPSGKITVTVTTVAEGKKRVDVSVETNKSSSLDTLRDSIAAAAKAMPEAKAAFSALLSSIEASMKNPSQPTDGKVVFTASVEIKDGGKNISLDAETTIGQQKISAKTNTVIADSGVASTSGAVNVENSVTGEIVSNPVNLMTNADGTNIGTVGSSSVASPSIDVQTQVAAQGAITLSTPEDASAQLPDPTIMDPTTAASGDK